MFQLAASLGNAIKLTRGKEESISWMERIINHRGTTAASREINRYSLKPKTFN
jgi:hypothetical protein